uniref:Uncharacterized protein n=1 Tax=Cacopsylla melanoneura TaxID=428564 RepID=A0A8D8VXR8_9HEMI
MGFNWKIFRPISLMGELIFAWAVPIRHCRSRTIFTMTIPDFSVQKQQFFFVQKSSKTEAVYAQVHQPPIRRFVHCTGVQGALHPREKEKQKPSALNVPRLRAGFIVLT